MQDGSTHSSDNTTLSFLLLAIHLRMVIFKILSYHPLQSPLINWQKDGINKLWQYHSLILLNSYLKLSTAQNIETTWKKKSTNSLIEKLGPKYYWYSSLNSKWGQSGTPPSLLTFSYHPFHEVWPIQCPWIPIRVFVTGEQTKGIKRYEKPILCY